MINGFDKIKDLFIEINSKLNNSINIFVIGGAVLLYQGLKDSTKDIDLIVSSKSEFLNL